MKIVVHKYGGSSLSTPESLKRVAQRVVEQKQAGCSVVVVVSAMGDTTDHLLKLARATSDVFPPRELDVLLTTGEQVSMALLSMAVSAAGQPAVSLTGPQAGIVTCQAHNRARIIEIRPHRVKAELEAGRIVVVAGFQGISYKGEVTTLGRGGSDTSAVALARALGAERCEIYTDVDGVFSADPRVVPEARRLPELDYDEMLEMSRAGAKVLNTDAVEIARASSLEIWTGLAHGEGHGTVVRSRGRQECSCLAIASRDDLLWVKLDESDTATKVESLVGESEVLLRSPHELLLKRENIPDLQELKKRTREVCPRGVAIDAVAGVSLVGVEASSFEGTARLILAEEQIPVMAGFARPAAVTFLLRQECLLRAVRLLHTRVALKEALL